MKTSEAYLKQRNQSECLRTVVGGGPALSFLITLLAVLFAVNAQAAVSLASLSTAPPALAFAQYKAFLNQPNPFNESESVAIDIDASLPRLGKKARLSAIRHTGRSDRGKFQVLHIEGDSMVKNEVIARYLSAQTQAEALSFSSTPITPANYKFHFVDATRAFGTLVYVFQITPRKRRVGLIQGQLWIDPVTGVVIHQTGRSVKTPSVLLRRIEMTRDTSLHDGLPYMRTTHVVVYTRLLGGPAELTITERLMIAPNEQAALQLATARGAP